MRETYSKNKDLAKLIGMKGSYEILEELEMGEKRFSELKKIVTHSTLAKRLPKLEEFNLIERKVLESRPPIVMYGLTAKGKEILDFFRKLKGGKDQF